jgi:predicted phosphodiesterase
MIKKALILPDIHFPNHNKELLSKVERYMSDEKWDNLVYLGDALDMDAISHHSFEDGNQRVLEGKRLKKDYEAFASILRKHRQIVGKKCGITFFKGNHEEWADQFVDHYPTLEGLVEMEDNLPFKELGIDIVNPRRFKKIGKVYFIHGDIGRGYVPTVHSKKIVEMYNRNIVYANYHTLQVYTKVSPMGIDETHTGICLPAMCDINPEWNKDKPTAWLNGFGAMFYNEDNFTILPIVAVHNKFIAPNGKNY